MEKYRVVIVEDELITRQALRYIIGLEQHQFEIVGEASNGKEAQTLIEKEKPHIVISDIVMPVMDGVELTKHIRLKYPDIHVIILSSHGDFEYVRSTFKYGIVEYILKPQLEPEQLLGIMNKLVKGSNTRRVEYKKPYFYILGCDLKRIQGYRKSKQNFYYEALVEMLDTYMEGVTHEVTLTNEAIMVIILNLDTPMMDTLLQRLEEMGEKMLHHIPGARISMGVVFQDAQNIGSEIVKVVEGLAFQFYSDASQKIFYVGNQTHMLHKEFNHKKYMEKMNRGLYQEGFSILRSFVNEVNSRSGIKEQELKKIVENAFYNTLNILEELQFELEEVSTKKLEMFERIAKTQYLEEFKCCIEDIIQGIEVILEQQKKTDHMVIKQMYNYIEEHYSEQITLNSLATVFHMSYSYLSTYFSSTGTKGFNEYLNEVRINKAKQLLTYSNISIADIGEQVGYGDQSYFSKVFKKMTNYSPSEYRRKALK